MQVGIDSFAAAYLESSRAVSTSDRLLHLVEQIEHADPAGLDTFGIGKHHRIDDDDRDDRRVCSAFPPRRLTWTAL